MKSVKLEYLDQAKRDLIEGYRFYESQQAGLGMHFLENLYSDIESLHRFGGIHRKIYGDYYRLLSKRFPYAMFYKIADGTAYIYAIVDCRRNPAWIRDRLM